MKFRIAVFPGDGIGPEVLHGATQILTHVGNRFGHEFEFQNCLIGGAAIDHEGTPISDLSIQTAMESDGVLLGAVGGPKWDNPDAPIRPEQGLLKLRKSLGVFANIRPVKTYTALWDQNPIKPEILKNVDIVVMRELTGGLYFGEKKREMVDGVEKAIDVLTYHDYEIERIARLAFEMAMRRKRKVTSVDKANVLESSRLWRKVVKQVAQDYPDVALDHVLVDTASMKLITSPAQFDVIVTENMFGDILTDEASVLSGSMGLQSSASLSVGKMGLYEPIHGSAPDIAGKGIANPIGAILSGALMLRYSFDLEEEAESIEKAVQLVIDHCVLSPDLGGSATTAEIINAVINKI